MKRWWDVRCHWWVYEDGQTESRTLGPRLPSEPELSYEEGCTLTNSQKLKRMKELFKVYHQELTIAKKEYHQYCTNNDVPESSANWIQDVR